MWLRAAFFRGRQNRKRSEKTQFFEGIYFIFYEIVWKYFKSNMREIMPNFIEISY